jgi:kinesin family protein 2/24
VKGIEQLKKNREERRQRQAVLKEEKKALMNKDPGNPNWEFLEMITKYREGIDLRPLQETDPVEDHKITVCIRKRPLNKEEMSRKEVDVISVPKKDQIVVHQPNHKVDLTKFLKNKHFRFDYAFDEICSNELVYKYTAKPLVKTIFEGGMATCFAYGQTGSGKTHTMGGNFRGKTQDYNNGIYAMVARDVFNFLNSPKYKELNVVVRASFFEIYNEKVFDLLAERKELRVLEDKNHKVQIKDLAEKTVNSVDEIVKLIRKGNTARRTGKTSANSNSSRSHAVFQIVLRSSRTNRIHGKFSLIDMAGNERGSVTTSAKRESKNERGKINMSLLALKKCIRALAGKDNYPSFRDSKLTLVLRDSFLGENARTCMISMISPGMSSCEQSLNTLRYANGVKQLEANDSMRMNMSPTSEQLLKAEDNGALDDSGPAELRTFNEGKISADQFKFHETQLQESHTNVKKMGLQWTELDKALLAMKNDQPAYCEVLELLLAEGIGALSDLKQKVTAFREQLVADKQISQKTKRPVPERHPTAHERRRDRDCRQRLRR